MSTFYQFSMNDIEGEQVDFSRYRGQVCMVVNLASECGYTPQYEGLQNLYEKHRGKGFSLLGFPCNQFANEEPGDNAQIQSFARDNYGVTFDLFSKIDVKGEDQAPLYAWLTSEENPWGPHRVRWNFQKYLISREGDIAGTFDPLVEPDHHLLGERLQELLKAPSTA